MTATAPDVRTLQWIATDALPEYAIRYLDRTRGGGVLASR